jgi:hypothetical protein
VCEQYYQRIKVKADITIACTTYTRQHYSAHVIEMFGTWKNMAAAGLNNEGPIT